MFDRMFIATLVVAALLALAYGAAAIPKIAGAAAMVTAAEEHGFTKGNYQVIGALELAGAVGLVVGLAVAPLGVAAAIGLIVLMGGAVVVHLRAKEAFKTSIPALALGLITVVELVLRIATS
jgi:hypothetical protein